MLACGMGVLAGEGFIVICCCFLKSPWGVSVGERDSDSFFYERRRSVFRRATDRGEGTIITCWVVHGINENS